MCHAIHGVRLKASDKQRPRIKGVDHPHAVTDSRGLWHNRRSYPHEAPPPRLPQGPWPNFAVTTAVAQAESSNAESLQLGISVLAARHPASVLSCVFELSANSIARPAVNPAGLSATGAFRFSARTASR